MNEEEIYCNTCEKVRLVEVSRRVKYYEVEIFKFCPKCKKEIHIEYTESYIED